MSSVWQRKKAAGLPFATDSRGGETVLVVEDEPAVRALIESMLELSGYRVLVAADAGEAIAISQSYELSIHLLLTDLEMPDMHGRELAQRLRAERPEMRLLYMSGHNDVEVAGYGVLASGALFLPKPFTVAALTARVREVLDNQSW